jgi:transcription elongation factor Elf1
MAYFFKLRVAFTCPACHKEMVTESVIESDSADLEAIASENTVPQKCALCGTTGIEYRVKVEPVPFT